MEKIGLMKQKSRTQQTLRQGRVFGPVRSSCRFVVCYWFFREVNLELATDALEATRDTVLFRRFLEPLDKSLGVAMKFLLNRPILELAKALLSSCDRWLISVVSSGKTDQAPLRLRDFHHVLDPYHGAQGKSVRNRLPKDRNVRFYSVVLLGPAGSHSEACYHFVKNQ